MCEICGFYPCDRRCPNHDAKLIDRCAYCGDTVYDDTDYWIDDADNIFCEEDCAKAYYGIREVP